MRERRHCPSPAELERASWTARTGAPLAEREGWVHEHVQGCEACAAAWRDIATLAEAGRRIEPARPWERREEIRTTLLSSLEQAREEGGPARAPSAGRRWWWGAPLAAAAAALWLAWPSPPPAAPSISPSPAAPVARHGSFLEHPGARAIAVSEPPDEAVRLVEGSLTVTVPALGESERFRVITGDGELTASGAAFDITAREDRLAAVRVLSGQVKILAAGATITAQRGETWRASTELAAAAPAPPPAPALMTPMTAPSPGQISLPHPGEPPTELPPPPAPPVPPVQPPADASSPPPPPSPPPPVEPAGSAAELPPPPPRSMAQQAFDDGWAALRASDFARAATAFERALAVTGDPRILEDAAFWRGVALARAAEIATAAHVFTAFLTAYPRSAHAGEARVALGWLLLERRDLAGSKAAFSAALSDPSARVRDLAQAGLAALARPR